MMRRLSHCFLVFCVCLGASSLMAQGPRPGHVPPTKILQVFFQLSETQMTDLQQLLEARRDAVRPLQEQLAAMQQQLRDLFEAGNPDPAAVGNLAIDMHDVRLQVRGARQDFKAGFESLLADDQKGKLEGLRRAARVVPVIKAAGQVGIL